MSHDAGEAAPQQNVRLAKPRDCPIADSLQLIGERWTLLVIREIGYGVHRFEDILANTGATRDTLATRLRKLESAGVITRQQYSAHPPRYEYHLATAGYALRPVLLALAHWGQEWVQENPSDLYTHDCGHELEMDYTCRHCGEAIAPGSYSISNTSDSTNL